MRTYDEIVAILLGLGRGVGGLSAFGLSGVLPMPHDHPFTPFYCAALNTETVEILRSSSMYCGFSSLFTPLNTSLSVP
jgi:hypothetical protein